MRVRFWPYGLVTALWFVYVWLSFTAPQTASSSQFHLSRLTISVLTITFLLPYLFTWLVAIGGWRYLRLYCRSDPNQTGEGLRSITRGLGLLTTALIVSPFIGALQQRATTTALTVGTMVVNNYLNVLFPLAAFASIFWGSNKLVTHAKLGKQSLVQFSAVAIPVIIFAAFYVTLVFTNPSRLTTYYVSDSVLTVTIVLPAIISWFLGLAAALNVESFMHRIEVHSSRAWGQFFNGLLAIITGAILVQAITSLGSDRLIALGIGPILALLYLFVLAQAAGFGFIMRGAKTLTTLKSKA